MRHSLLKQAILAQFKVTNEIPFLLLGPPGGGKSALCREVAAEVLSWHDLMPVYYDSATDNVDEANIVEFTGSTRDPTDILGLPNNTGDWVRWVSSAEFYALRRGRGPKVLIMEEVTDSLVPMQNAICRVIYDRYAGNLRLSDQLYVLASGNRVEDKSGANRVTTKLGNRLCVAQYEVHMDDWVEWAKSKGIDSRLIQFLRFRPNLLHAPDPNIITYPSPRAWEKVAMAPMDLPSEVYFGLIAGHVGEGAAAEFTSFLRVYLRLPHIDALIVDPKRAEVPTDMAVLYALVGALAHRLRPETVDNIFLYAERLQPEFQAMLVNDGIKLQPAIKKTKAFTNWAQKNHGLFM